MKGEDEFQGFPGIAKATAIPNLFFSAVLPRLRAADDLLAFLWAAKCVQEQRGGPGAVTAAQIWAEPGAPDAFETMGTGRPGLDAGLRGCVSVGALLALRLIGEGPPEDVFFVNNPPARRAIARIRAGELEVRPGVIAEALPMEARPGIFRLYEENIGTITPIIGERLLAAADEYSWAWIEAAFREAAELNKRNWRYIERMLQRWDAEGRSHETAGTASFEDRQRKYLGGALDHIISNR
ncbi:MAG: DnaD domain-containing protein [Dehalococcoidia bacterium]